MSMSIAKLALQADVLRTNCGSGRRCPVADVEPEPRTQRLSAKLCRLRWNLGTCVCGQRDLDGDSER